MLCSIPTNKSGSTWLDRLRTSKGFPVQTGLDLEHFLNPNPNASGTDISPNSNTQDEDRPSPNPTSIPADAKSAKISAKSLPRLEKKSDDWFEIMSSVLSELFNMGDPHEIDRIRAFQERKRALRKQSNPKICSPSASGSVGESCLGAAGVVPALSPSSADNSIAEAKRSDDRSMPGKQGVADSASPEEEISQAVAVDVDLSAFSRAEVTIIDTSAPVWKSEKLIFRKGSVWKVRDKKQSSGSASRRKRKVDQLDGRGDADEKQQKRSPLPSKACKEAVRDECLISSNGEEEKPTNPGIARGIWLLLNPKHGILERLFECITLINAMGCLRKQLQVTHNGKGEASKETPDNLSQILERRSQFSRSSRKSAIKDSSVFLIQCIPTGRKNDPSGSKSRLKDKR